MTEMRKRNEFRVNDISDYEDPRVLTVANAFAQVRLGYDYDVWYWSPCSQDDVDRARMLVQSLEPWGATVWLREHGEGSMTIESGP